MSIQLTDRISYIPSSESPLSADVAIIKGDSRTYIFDVGNGERYLREINSIEGDKTVILSHFHTDHTANLQYLGDIPCFVGANTYKYTKRGTIADKSIHIDDGVRLHIFPLPSSHAKGSLALEIDEDFAFIGDAAGPAIKPGKLVYNAQILLEEIRALKGLKAAQIVQSHGMGSPQAKSALIGRLETIYARRNGSAPYIEIDTYPE